MHHLSCSHEDVEAQPTAVGILQFIRLLAIRVERLERNCPSTVIFFNGAVATRNNGAEAASQTFLLPVDHSLTGELDPRLSVSSLMAIFSTKNVTLVVDASQRYGSLLLFFFFFFKDVGPSEANDLHHQTQERGFSTHPFSQSTPATKRVGLCGFEGGRDGGNLPLQLPHGHCTHRPFLGPCKGCDRPPPPGVVFDASTSTCGCGGFASCDAKLLHLCALTSSCL